MNLMRLLTVWHVASFLLLSGCRTERKLVVFEIQDSGDQLTTRALEQLSAYLAGKIGEDEAFRVLPGARSKCAGPDLGCLDQATSELGGDFFLTARVLRPGDSCGLVLRLYERQNRGTLRSTSVRSGCAPSGLMEAIDQAVYQFSVPGVESPAMAVRSESHAPQVHKPEPAKTEELPLAESEPVVAPKVVKPEVAPRPAPVVAQKPAPKPGVSSGPSLAKAKPRPVPKSREDAFLSVGSRPWANVLLDGSEIGYTPIVKTTLPAGHHAVLLKTSDGRKRSFRISLKPGEHVRVFGNFDEEPEAEEIPETGGPAVKPQYGELTINSSPWAKLSVDGEPVGNTPIIGYKLEAGEHRLTLETTDGLSKELTVTIRPNQSLKKIVKFPGSTTVAAARPPLETARKNDPGFLSINSIPWANVYIDGKPVGTTPINRIKLAPGTHRVSFESPQGKMIEKQIQVMPGKSERLDVRLAE